MPEIEDLVEAYIEESPDLRENLTDLAGDVEFVTCIRRIISTSRSGFPGRLQVAQAAGERLAEIVRQHVTVYDGKQLKEEAEEVFWLDLARWEREKV